MLRPKKQRWRELNAPHLLTLERLSGGLRSGGRVENRCDSWAPGEVTENRWSCLGVNPKAKTHVIRLRWLKAIHPSSFIIVHRWRSRDPTGLEVGAQACLLPDWVSGKFRRCLKCIYTIYISHVLFSHVHLNRLLRSIVVYFNNSEKMGKLWHDHPHLARLCSDIWNRKSQHPKPLGMRWSRWYRDGHEVYKHIHM